MIDVLNLPPGEILKVCPEICDIECFAVFISGQKSAQQSERVPIRETIVYIILLYSKDSFLNKKPVEPLPTRIFKSARLAGLNTEDEAIQKAIFELDNESVRDTVVDYLIYQNVSKWSNRCAIEAQMAENLRIRFKPIQNEKADKDIINKHLLTEHYSDYENEVKKLDSDIFLGHDNIRDIAVRRKTSLESLIK